MKIVITGNQGYVGPILARHLRARFPDATLIGYDTGLFAHALSGSADSPERVLNAQVYGDVRELPTELLQGADAVVHLAAVSNDPMGVKFEAVTEDVNQTASVAIAEKALAAGVKNFVFASSCSVYGFAPGGARREEDDLAPQTAYARSKVGTERALVPLAGKGMVISCLRFATACGMSDRLRLDLVLNDFVACAITKGEITVLSDGTPWRPLIDVRDMARAVEWAAQRTADNGGDYIAVNIGDPKWNYQVKDLAAAVARLVPGTTVSINTSALPDKRSYQVDFSLFHSLAPAYVPQITLDHSIELLRDGLSRMGFADADFRNSPFIRLKMLEAHMAAGRLSGDLRWLS
jgi:nucleoside-diphosphate-sugar epimerase